MRKGILSILQSFREELTAAPASLLLLRGAALVSLANALGLLFSLGLAIVVARLLGPESYGIYEVCLAATGVLVLAASAGIDTSVLRFVASYQERREWQLLHSVLAWAQRNLLRTSLCASALIVLGAVLLREHVAPEYFDSIILSAVLLPLWALNNLRQAALKGLQRALLARVPEVLLRPVITLCCIGLLSSFVAVRTAPQALTAVLIAMLAAFVVGKRLLAFALLGKASATSAAQERAPVLREWGISSYWLLAVTAAFVLLTEIDKLVLSLVLPAEAVGLYAAAARLATIVPYAAEAASSVAAPLISAAYAANDRKRLESLLAYSALASVLLAIVPALLLVLFGQAVLGLSGAQFERAYPALCILVLGQALQLCFGPAIHVLLMSAKSRHALVPLAGIFLMMLCLTPSASLAYGIEGAAASVALVLCLRSLLLWNAVRSRLGIDSSLLPVFTKGLRYLLIKA